MPSVQPALGHHDPAAMAFFGCFIVLSLAITFWAARRTRSTSDFFVAGAKITAFQNALAITGEFIAAAGFLGIAGYVSLNGADGIAFATYSVVGFAMLMFLVAEPLRNLGKYTFSDVLAYRTRSVKIRVVSALNGLVVVILYIIMQMVGGGSLLHLLFGMPYRSAVILLGTLLVIYTMFGGMITATWLQIVKTALMLSSALAMVILVLIHFGGDPLAPFRIAVTLKGSAILGPARMMSQPAQALSLAIGLFGVVSLPQLLIRFYTVPDVRVARRSLLYSILILAGFQTLWLFLGFAAMVLVGSGVIQAADKGGNMAIPLLAEYLGGSIFLAFVVSVAFAAILAVVSGLIVTGSTALSYDIWSQAIRKGNASQREQLIVGRLSVVLLCLTGVILGLLLQGQNIAWLVSLGSGLSASTIFPALILALYWPKLTAMGAGAGLITGLLSSVMLIFLSPLVQVDILHHVQPIIELRNPAIVAVPLAFVVTWVISLLTHEADGLRHFKEEVDRQMVLGRAADI
jgi:cation/acetate symporter